MYAISGNLVGPEGLGNHQMPPDPVTSRAKGWNVYEKVVEMETVLVFVQAVLVQVSSIVNLLAIYSSRCILI